jgi:hypothetical protein
VGTDGFTNQTEADVRRFFEERAKRTLRYLDQASIIRQSGWRYRNEIQQLQSDGCVLLPEFFSRDSILGIGQQVDALIHNGDHLMPLKDRARKIVGAASEGLPMRDRASSIGIDDPLLHLPGVIDLAFDARVLGLATAYFQTVPLLSYVKVRQSFVNEIPSSPTQQFHVDIGAVSIFKVLLYLNDVGHGGGPFCYVQTSHREKFDGWESRRYSRDDMAAIYGAHRVVRFHARAGDAMVVESAGFHCGEKPQVADRKILIFNYTVYPEYGFEYPPVRIRRQDLEALPEYARLVADALVVEPSAEADGLRTNVAHR